MEGGQHFEANTVHVSNVEQELMGINVKSLLIGFLLCLNLVLGIMVYVLFDRITDLEHRLEEKISISKQEVISILRQDR